MCFCTVSRCLHINFTVVLFRYTVVLNGREAIHEALVKHSLDFSDRPGLYTNATVFNIHSKGKALFTVLLLLPINVSGTVNIFCSSCEK